MIEKIFFVLFIYVDEIKAFYEEFIQSYKLSKKREAFLLILLNERIRLILLLNTSFQLPFLGKRTHNDRESFNHFSL